MRWMWLEIWLMLMAFVAGTLVVMPTLRALRRARERIVDALSKEAIQGEIVEVPVYIERPVLADEPLLRAQFLLTEMPLLEEEEKAELLEVVKRRSRHEP